MSDRRVCYACRFYPFCFIFKTVEDLNKIALFMQSPHHIADVCKEYKVKE